MADEQDEAARRLEERLGRASDQAQRLISEAARMAQQNKPPPAGWTEPGGEEAPARTGEIDALIQAVVALRELVPAEVVERLATAVRELLLALRALLDYYIDRLEGRGKDQVEVEDIPIQ